MRGKILPVISLSCLRAGGCQVSAHLGEPWGWWRSGNQPWTQCSMSRWLIRRFLLLKK
ncbi:hypothetical protein Hanom_Chr12g01159971 [Helianthus anomalus]